MNDKVRSVLESVLERFKSGDIPEAVTYSLFPIPDIPSAKWSVPRQPQARNGRGRYKKTSFPPSSRSDRPDRSSLMLQKTWFPPSRKARFAWSNCAAA